MGFSKLEKAIKSASQKYYTDGTSPIPDDEFDKLTDRLKTEQPDSPLLNQVGWGYDVEEYASASGKTKVKHKYGIVGSLSKAYCWGEISRRLQQEKVDASLKLDGLSAVLYYQNGKFYQALTRGQDGFGIDITNKVNKILKSNQLKCNFTGAIRGELFMTHNNFVKYKCEFDVTAKNARNTTAGIINKNDASDAELSLVDLGVYSVVGCENMTFNYISDVRTFLSDEFECVAPSTIIYLDEDKYLEKLESLKSQWYNMYPADGIVLTESDIDYDPETYQVFQNAQAFKFGAEFAETTVTGVTWELTKTRRYMPTVNVETVELSGTNVSNATGYNAQYIGKNKIGVGTKLIISKHGEIIPNIDKVTEPTIADMPTVCPDCGTELEWCGVDLVCPNKECGNAKIQDLLVWLQTLAPTDNLGDLLKMRYIEEFFPSDDMSIEEFMNSVMNAEKYTNIISFGRRNGKVQTVTFFKMIDKLLCRNEFKDNRFSIEQAVQALNIPRFGEITCQKLKKEYKLFRALYKLIMLEDGEQRYEEEKNVWEIKFSSAIGTANANSLLNNIDKIKRLRFIENYINWEPDSEKAVEIKGNVAVTGSLSVSRAKFVEELKQHGYAVKDINKSTIVLITDDPNTTTAKNQKADELGIPKITEAEFRGQYLR